MELRKEKDSCLIVLIFGVVAHYVCIHLQNENQLIVYSNAGCTPVNMDDDFRPGTNWLRHSGVYAYHGSYYRYGNSEQNPSSEIGLF